MARFALACSAVSAASATLYPLPPRGWNSWFAFDVHVNESVIRSNAAALVSTGLAAAGYRYVNLDGGWQGGRFPNGTVYENATLFPSGFAALGAYIHNLNLSFGGYTDRGTSTCDRHVGSQGYYLQDADSYAAWGMDYVKVDSCSATMSHAGALGQFDELQVALNSTGRNMFYSLCGWLKWYAAAGTADVGNAWRIGPDALSWQNVLMNLDAASDAAAFVGPGRFADIDEIMGPSRGRPISPTQTATQFAFIAIIGSPLLLSFDLTSMSASDPDVALFLNKEILAVHWDAHPTGPIYRKLAGGYVGQGEISPLTNLSCDAGSTAAKWAFQPTINATVGYLQSVGAPGMCLHAGAAWYGECNNAQQAWLLECGGTKCCNADCTNQQVSINTDGTITTLYYPDNNNAPGPYLTQDSVPNSLFWEERFNGTAANAQTWAYDNVTGLIRSGAGGCIGGAPRDDRNVWGRALFDGSWAILFANFNAQLAQVVTCDVSCFAAAGFAANATFSVRDLFAHTDNGTASAAAGYSVMLGEDGASAMLKFTPQ